MLSLYRPGTGWLHRAPAAPKGLALAALAVAVFFLPSTWAGAAIAGGGAIAAYAVSGLGRGLGMPELARQVWSLRWVIAFMLVSQTLFLGVESAVANTVRVTAAVVLAGILVLTTPLSALLDAAERGLRPLRMLRVDPERAALLLVVALGTVPVLARVARDVREAQRARGARAGLATFAVPFLVVSLKHADELGDALAARGVR